MIRPKTSFLGAGAVLLAAGLLLGACGGGTTTAAPTTAPTTAPTSAASSGTGAGAGAAIADFSFTPADLSVKVGQEITWTNGGSASHTVTFDSGVDSGTLKAGATFKHTFDAAGSFTYHCNFHPAMKATVTVTP